MLEIEEINQLRSSIDIVDVISSYLPLTQKGKNFFGVCPFHDDHSPSMSVSKEKQIYTCFSCGATGNVFKFLMDYENITFPEAIQKVADKVGIHVNVNVKRHQIKSTHQDLYDIYDYALKCYQNHLNTETGQAAVTYLKDRDIGESIIKEFQIGLSYQKRDQLTQMLTKKKYDAKQQIRSGLIMENEYGLADMYYNRIMFPLYDMMGRVVGFSGRVYHGEKEFKYVNTKETEIFKKGELLYNYHRAKDAARIQNKVIVVEGFMDVIRAYTIGIKNVIATMGTAVTRKQALSMKKMAKEIILCFDGDGAGEKATFSCINELLAIGVTPKVVRLEEQLDPDDYIKTYGKDQFERKLNDPMNIMDFKMGYYKNHLDLQNSMDIAKYVNDMIEEITKIEDDVLKELTLRKLSSETGLEQAFLKDKLVMKKELVPAVRKESNTSSKRKKMSKIEQAERNLIYYMLKSKEVMKIYQKQVTFLPTESYRFLAREMLYYFKTYHEINAADFLTSIADKPNLMETMGSILSMDLKEEYTIDEIEDYIRAIQCYNIDYEINRMKDRMKKEVDLMKKAEYAQKIVELKLKGEQLC